MNSIRNKESLYFDCASTTPLDPRVFGAMKPYFEGEFGNPANIYRLGHKAKVAVDDALSRITSIFHCSPEEFVFTGSATESDNLAILGTARANKKFGNKIIISNVEHKGIIAACNKLAKEGFEIVELKVDKDGLVDPKKLRGMLDDKTILVSVTYADNETGTIQPIPELAKIIRKFREQKNIRTKELSKMALPILHTDATQTASYLDLNVEKLGVDLMTLSAHKIYGPKGIGGLYIREGVSVEPIVFGGGQQNKLRSGTENIPAIVGFARALSFVHRERKKEYQRIKKLRDKLEKGIFKSIPKVTLNGHPTRRLPNFLNVSILGIEGEATLLSLDQKGIYVSTGSACNSQNLQPSYILKALGKSYPCIHGSIRFSLGKSTTASGINYVLKHLPVVVKKLRQISPIKFES